MGFLLPEILHTNAWCAKSVFFKKAIYNNKMKTKMKTTTTITAIVACCMFSTLIQAQEASIGDSRIDRYTIINNIETPAQENPLLVVVSMKFTEATITVKQAIEALLRQSGYKLDNNYEAAKIGNFKLPKVHREIGPIALLRAIRVLLGSAWDLQIDEVSRTIQIVQVGGTTLQVLDPDARTLLKNVITPDVLDEIVAVSIEDTLLPYALEKILPVGWKVRLEGEGLNQETVSIISEDLKREDVIKRVLLSANAIGYFYKKLKMLVVIHNTKVIK